MKIFIFYTVLMGLLVTSLLSSCEEKNILTNENDVSYLVFEKDMTKDTTTVSFKFYNEGDEPQIPLKVSIYGKMQDKDLEFTVSADLSRTKLPASQYVLPEKCVVKAGELTGEIAIKLKNYEALKNQTDVLVLQINEGGEVRRGDAKYSRAVLAITDRLFKPDWWSINDAGSDDNFSNTIEDYYLGEYSELKYQMFLAELKKDGVVFDGKNMALLRKYAIRLKNTIKDINASRPDNDPLCDKDGVPLVIPIAG